jgi:hypothetical protein
MQHKRRTKIINITKLQYNNSIRFLVMMMIMMITMMIIIIIIIIIIGVSEE